MSNQSTAYRLQHTIPATFVFLVAAAVTYLSYTQEPADANIFPRLISIFFIGLAIWNLARALLGIAKVGDGLNKKSTMNFLPGVLVMLVFVLFAAKTFGFYVSSFTAFLIIFTLYDPVPFSSLKDWVKRIVVTAAFMVVIYGLFAKLLFVQTPRGFFF